MRIRHVNVTKQADDTGGDDRKKCNRCLRVKSLDAFYFRVKRKKHDSICYACQRINSSIRRNTDEYKQWLSDHRKKEEIRERKIEVDRKYRRVNPNTSRKYHDTVRGRLIMGLSAAKNRLRKAYERDAKRCFIDRIQKTVDGYESELKRYDQSYKEIKRKYDGNGKDFT